MLVQGLAEREDSPHTAAFPSFTQAFYMPTRSDEGVRAFRQWLQKFGGGGPQWAVSYPRQ